MLGGIDLAMKPMRLASPGVASERTMGAPCTAGASAVLPVTVEGRTLQGTVLPVTPGAALPRSTNLDGVAPELDSGGRVTCLIDPTGRSIDYAYDAKVR